MRPTIFGSLLVLGLIACNPLSGGADRGSTTSAKNATSPGTSGDDEKIPPPAGEPALPETSAVCSRYVTCIAKTSPALLGEVSDAYGKSGSCWDEMSAGECESACELGLEQAGCPTCDPSASSCIGESCKSTSECASGELCAAKTCIVDAHMKKCASSSCPAPYECKSMDGSDTPDMLRCVIPCKSSTECPADFVCNGVCMNSDSLPEDP